MSDHKVFCAKLKQELPGLPEPPFDSDLGKKIYENVSQQAWGQWQALAQGYLVGKIVKRIGEAKLLSVGIILFAIGLAPMANLPTPTALMLALALLSIGYGFASPTIASLISKRTERALEGEALGINQSASSMARILGPLAGGLAYGALGISAPYVGGAIVAVMAFILARGVD